MPWHSTGRNKDRPTLAGLASYVALAAFLTVFFTLGLLNRGELTFSKKQPQYDFPDFDRIDSFTRTLTPDNVDLKDAQSRIILMGDVHGMNDSLHKLLEQLEFDPNHDTVFFAGDLMAKSTHSTSLAVLSYLAENHTYNGMEKMFAVRGNHDHMIVQWRAWREWFETLSLDPNAASPSPRFFSALCALHRTLPSLITRFFAEPVHRTDDAVPPVKSGTEFLQLIEAEWAIARAENDADPEEFTDVARKRAQGTWRAEWWRRIPPPGKGRAKQQWNMFGDHYWLARDITQEQAKYLMSLPLVHHVPHLHFFVVHAGLLPSDPRLPPTDPRQPLAHAPAWSQPQSSPLNAVLLSRLHTHLTNNLASEARAARQPASDASALEDLRRAQEAALLSDVPQNRDPWVVLNMRSVTKKHEVTRKDDKGTPWAELWNAQMAACGGFDAVPRAQAARKGKGYALPCHPATVVYGHAASRGLDLRRWSMGLDTGCLYGRELTALVLSNTTGVEGAGAWYDAEDDEDEWEEEEDEDEDDEDEDEEDEEDDDAANTKPKKKKPSLQFGDAGSRIEAKVVNVRCPNMDDDDD